MANNVLPLKSMELYLRASERYAKGEAILSNNPVSRFFDWLLDTRSFGCAVLVPERGILQRIFHSHREARPQATISSEEFRARRPTFETAAMSGSRLVVGVRARSDILVAFFLGLGYHVEGTGLYASGDPHDPIGANWQAEDLMQCIDVATALGQSTLCIFAHDADPVYILYREDS